MIGMEQRDRALVVATENEDPMLDPRALKPRQGRFRRNAGAYPLPTMWIEVDDPFDATIESMQEFWQLPGVYPFIPIDLRQNYDASGATGFDFTERPPTPAEFADLVQGRIEQYQSSFGPVFAAVGKALRVAIKIAGPDTPLDDCPLRIITDPEDVGTTRRAFRAWGFRKTRTRPRRNRNDRTPEPFSGSEHVDTPEQVKRIGQTFRASFFSVKGRERVRSWAVGAFAAAADQLASHSPEPLPFPETIVTDIESFARDTYNCYPIMQQLSPKDAREQSEAWFHRAIRDWQTRVDNIDYLLDGSVRFGEWLAKRNQTLSGDPLPDFTTYYYPTHPVNNEHLQRAMAANQASAIRSYHYALFEPMRMAFGPSLRCANWNMFADSRQSPLEVRPGQFRHYSQGVFGQDFQTPALYPIGRENDVILPPGDPDPRWNVPWNWIPRLQAGQYTGTPERDHVWVLEMRSGMDRASAISSDVPLFPSTSVFNLVFPTSIYADEASFLIERVLRAADIGARQFWIHAPAMVISVEMRLATKDFVTSVLQRLAGSMARRNAIGRRQGISIPLVVRI